jgi:hypothetical protein
MMAARTPAELGATSNKRDCCARLRSAQTTAHSSHIRIDVTRQALDALDAAWRNAAPNRNGDGDSSKGKEEAPDEGGIDALVEVPDDFTSQSRHRLRLSGSPPSGKLSIPDGRERNGATWRSGSE